MMDKSPKKRSDGQETVFIQTAPPPYDCMCRPHPYSNPVPASVGVVR